MLNTSFFFFEDAISSKNTRLALPDNRNFVLSIHVAGVVLKSLKINEVGGKTIYLLSLKYRNFKLDLCIGEPMQICIHWKDSSPKPVTHCLTLKEGPKVKSNIRRFLAQDFI